MLVAGNIFHFCIEVNSGNYETFEPGHIFLVNTLPQLIFACSTLGVASELFEIGWDFEIKVQNDPLMETALRTILETRKNQIGRIFY